MSVAHATVAEDGVAKFCGPGMNIEWVDDQHDVGVFAAGKPGSLSCSLMHSRCFARQRSSQSVRPSRLARLIPSHLKPRHSSRLHRRTRRSQAIRACGSRSRPSSVLPSFRRSSSRQSRTCTGALSRLRPRVPLARRSHIRTHKLNILWCRYFEEIDSSKTCYGTMDPKDDTSLQDLGVKASTVEEWLARTGWRAPGYRAK